MKELNLQKLKTKYSEGEQVQYYLQTATEEIHLNQFLDKSIRFEYTGEINCSACDRKSKKSFGQGHCFPCFRSLARCDMCLMKPETCHYDAGTCREPEWGESNCLIPHTVYLANSSGLKVGITRGLEPIGRWLDQGAVAAIPLATVPKRLDAGTVEMALKEHVADKTNWRVMLRGEAPEVDLLEARNRLSQYIPESVDAKVSQEDIVNIEYPVLEFPTKIKSFNFDKDPVVEGVLKGIKGQYLIFDQAVINIRKFTGYKVKINF